MFDLKIHCEKREGWFTGWVEWDGEKHYPTDSKHVEKWIYNCIKVVIRHLIPKIKL